MSSKAEQFLKKNLGEDFMESLLKVELWKPGTKTTVDHEEIRTALQIVPRTIMALLIRELAPMAIGDNKVIHLFPASDARLEVTKHERDVYSGEVIQDNKKLTEFKFRSIPGVGLVVMSAFELYDMDNLINSPNPEPHAPAPADDASEKVQRIIDERLSLHDLIGKVVDRKLMEKDAVQQLILAKLTDKISAPQQPIRVEAPHYAPVDSPVQTPVKIPKKLRPLEDFLEKHKSKGEYSIVMAKGETVDCPDCRKNIFDGKVFSGCICLGDDMARRVFIKKSEDGIKVRFSKGWDEENIEMLLEVLRKKHE